MKIAAIICLLMVGNAFPEGTWAQAPKVASSVPASEAWQIPFGSTGNTISLAVQNNSGIAVEGVTVSFNNLPLSPSAPSSTWLKFQSSTIMLKSVPAGGTGDAEFTFSVDKKAPVGKDTTLTATISTADGEAWTKEIKMEVAAPKDYKLYNNFPNPFNPSTKIAFELPKASHATLVIYDIVGREVAKVADGDYPAGYNEVSWNGLNSRGEEVSSGVYFYRIVAGGWSKVMKMMLVR